MSQNIAKKENDRLIKSAIYAAVIVAISLILLKAYAWYDTKSLSILGTLADSVLDIGASIVNLFAVTHALKPADDDHRFGHGKLEAIAGLGQATFILVSAFFLLYQSFLRIHHNEAATDLSFGIGVMIFSVAVTAALVSFQNYVIKRTGSLAVRSDAAHYRGDLLVNASVLVGLFAVQKFGFAMLDSLLAIAISFYIGYSSFHILKDSFNVLMDRELDDEIREKIHQIATAHEQIQGIHDLRTRSTGSSYFIQLHVELDDKMSLKQAHAISDELEKNIQKEFPLAEVFIHQDIKSPSKHRKK